MLTTLRLCLVAVLLPTLSACTVYINMVPPLENAGLAPSAVKTEAPTRDNTDNKARSKAKDPSQKLAGEWLEHWADRVGCKDTARIKVVGDSIEIMGSDCNNGEAYEITEEAFDGRFLRFRLRVPETDFDLFYKLEFVDQGTLEGEVKGSTRAKIKWLKL